MFSVFDSYASIFFSQYPDYVIQDGYGLDFLTGSYTYTLIDFNTAYGIKISLTDSSALDHEPAVDGLQFFSSVNLEEYDDGSTTENIETESDYVEDNSSKDTTFENREISIMDGDYMEYTAFSELSSQYSIWDEYEYLIDDYIYNPDSYVGLEIGLYGFLSEVSTDYATFQVLAGDYEDIPMQATIIVPNAPQYFADISMESYLLLLGTVVEDNDGTYKNMINLELEAIVDFH